MKRRFVAWVTVFVAMLLATPSAAGAATSPAAGSHGAGSHAASHRRESTSAHSQRPQTHPGASGLTPPKPYSQQRACVTAGTIRPSVHNGISWAQRQLGYTSLWPLATGAGVKIAVIDTGVTPNPAFGSRLHGGGDLVVAGGNGLSDCDGHGTLVAGIIAARTDAKTGFAGVAPGATLLSIRQSSDNFVSNNAKTGNQRTAGTPTSLADAINYAVSRGAGVINISEASCGPDASALPTPLRRAVKHADAHGVVIVAAAGNVQSGSQCGQQNVPGHHPSTYAVPASLPGVLTVAAVDEAGRPASFTLAGPWVDVAAPGTSIVSTTPVSGRRGQINAEFTGSGVAPIQGTSFAAPYVTGLVALIEERFAGRHLTPAQVIARVERTAEHPAANGQRNDYVGYGMIDPRAALTDALPKTSSPTPSHATALAALPARPHKDNHAREIALVGLGAILAMLIAVGLGTATVRARRAAAAHR